MRTQRRDAAASGRTTAFVALDGVAAGLIAIGDPVKPESAAAVARTDRRRDRRLARSPATAARPPKRSRRQVGIPRERVRADARPADKAAFIETLRAERRRRRDGRRRHQRRSCPRRADLGVAIGTGADVAIEASDVTLVGGDPRAVAAAIALSRATMRGHPPEPVLGVRLQRRAHPGRDGRALPDVRDHPEPGARRRGDGAVVRVGRGELSAPARLRRQRRGVTRASSRARRRAFESFGTTALIGTAKRSCPAATIRRVDAPAQATPTDPRDLIGPFSHRVTIEVRFADTDAMGHVNNATYLTYCEIARIKYWTDVTAPDRPPEAGARA